MTPWLLEEQQDLESALAGSSGDAHASPAFWDSVSQRLGTKTPEQCLARFLVLRSIVRAAYPSLPAASVALGTASPSLAGVASEPARSSPAGSLPVASAAAQGPADAIASRARGPAFLSLPPQQQPDHPHVAGRLQRTKANERVSLAALEEELPARVLAAAPYPHDIRGYVEEEEDEDEDAAGGSGDDGDDATGERVARGGDDAAAARAVGVLMHPDDEGSASGDEEPPSQPMFSGLTLDPAHKGHVLRLGGLSLFGVGAVASSGISVNVSCTRCSMLVSARLGGVRLPSKGASSDPPQRDCVVGGGCRGQPDQGLAGVVPALQPAPLCSVQTDARPRGQHRPRIRRLHALRPRRPHRRVALRHVPRVRDARCGRPLLAPRDVRSGVPHVLLSPANRRAGLQH